MSNVLTISIYKRGSDKASLVFRRDRVLYRITTVEPVKFIAGHLNTYLTDLKNGVAERELVLELKSPRNRRHVLEMATADDLVTVCVFDLSRGEEGLCFKWSGTTDGLMPELFFSPFK